MGLKIPKNGDELLAAYYLELRSHLLEAAAILDRVDAAGGTQDPRLARLLLAGRRALDAGPERARRFHEQLSL